MKKKVALSILGVFLLLGLLVAGVIGFNIYEIKNISLTKNELEYRVFYKVQAEKEFLTEEEFNELKRREKLMFQGKPSEQKMEIKKTATILGTP
ncbi:MAG: hypothetical protein COA42_17730 [Alteromonadaceae bacterium]|nr:MAG: hypothetical protein COA42_17730 [Alteromonadaceae bacterium]